MNGKVKQVQNKTKQNKSIVSIPLTIVLVSEITQTKQTITQTNNRKKKASSSNISSVPIAVYSISSLPCLTYCT